MKAQHRLLFAVLVVSTAAACELLEEKDRDPPVLFGFGFDIEPYDAGTGRAGAFVLDTALDSIFTEFGAMAPSFGYEFVLSTGADIVSPLAGVVSSLTYDETQQDYELRIRPKTDSVWQVIVSNLSQPQIANGDTLAAGEPLGLPGRGGPLGYGRLGLRVNDTDKDLAYCPLALFDESVFTSAGAELAAALSSFEAVKDDPDIYLEDAWVLPGCQDERIPY